MNPKCSVYVGVSLDGYLARQDGAIDWLDRVNQLIPAGEDCGYQQFMATVDALVMGRNTFELVAGFNPWPYGEKPVFVLSHSLPALPPGLPATVKLLRLSPKETVRRLAEMGHHHLYIDGGLTIQSFLREGLIDELTITTVPVLIGAGRALFGDLPADVMLEHLSTRAFPFGFVQSKYRVRCTAA